jgi:hypothetical protein
MKIPTGEVLLLVDDNIYEHKKSHLAQGMARIVGGNFMKKLNHININSRLIIHIFMFILTVELASAGLSETYQLSKIDMAAMQLNFYSRVAWNTIIDQYNVLLLAAHETKDDKITLHIYGAQDNLDIAQRTIEMFRNLLADDFIPYLLKKHAIDLKVENVRVVYRNRNEEGAKKIWIWEDGKFKFPIGE